MADEKKNITVEQFSSELPKSITKAAITLGGYFLGKIGIVQLNKLIDKRSVSGVLGATTETVKQYGSPLVVGLAGAGVSLIGKNKRSNNVKHLGLGVTVAGAGAIVEGVAGEGLVKGLTGLGASNEDYLPLDMPTDVPPSADLNLPRLSGQSEFNVNNGEESAGGYIEFVGNIDVGVDN